MPIVKHQILATKPDSILNVRDLVDEFKKSRQASNDARYIVFRSPEDQAYAVKPWYVLVKASWTDQTKENQHRSNLRALDPYTMIVNPLGLSNAADKDFIAYSEGEFLAQLEFVVSEMLSRGVEMYMVDRAGLLQTVAEQPTYKPKT